MVVIGKWGRTRGTVHGGLDSHIPVLGNASAPCA